VCGDGGARVARGSRLAPRGSFDATGTADASALREANASARVARLRNPAASLLHSAPLRADACSHHLGAHAWNIARPEPELCMSSLPRTTDRLSQVSVSTAGVSHVAAGGSRRLAFEVWCACRCGARGGAKVGARQDKRSDGFAARFTTRLG
jgi:hypothetical protein